MPEVMHPSRGRAERGTSDWDLAQTPPRMIRRLRRHWRAVACYLPRWDRRGL